MIRLASASALLWAASLIGAEAPGRLELTVVDSATRTPVSGAVVELQRISKGPASTRHATTDQYGHAKFGQVDPGQHRVAHIEVEGYGYEWSGATYEVAGGATANGLATVFRLGVIEGTVTDEMEQPMADAKVVALKYSYQGGMKALLSTGGVSGVRTDTQGRYRIDRLQPGVYYVRVTSGKGLFPAVYYPNAVSTGDAVHVTMAPAGNINADLRVRPTDPFHLRGKVFGNPDNIPARLDIESCTEGAREFGAYTTVVGVQSDGAFDVGGIPRGRYCLTFVAVRGKEEIAYARDVVRIADKDVDGIRLFARPILEMSGSVTLESGKALAMPTAVQLTMIEGPGTVPMPGKVDAQTGVFRMSVWPGQYRVRVEGSLGEYVRAIRFAGREVTNGIIDTAAGGALEIDVAAARGRLHGRVKGAAGSVTVTLVSEGGRVDQFRELSIVNDDEFTLHDLAPGRYKVYAWQSYQPDLVRSPEFLRTFPATTVEVIDNQQAEIEVGLISTAEIVAGMERF